MKRVGIKINLGVKLGAAFLGILIALVALNALFLSREIPARFQEFRHESGLSQARQLAGLLSFYYLRTGSWAGVEPFLEAEGHRMAPGGEHQGPETDYVGIHFLLADREGRVVVPHGQAVGEPLPAEDLAEGVPIVVRGRTVGFLLPAMGHFDPLERGFLSALGRAQLLAGLIGLALALALAAVLIRRITRPLRRLAQVAERAAQGGVPALEAVPVKTGDEVGQLGQAFNRMAESLRLSEELRKCMLQDIAHELRNPLMVLRSRLEALQDGYLELSPETLASLHEETLLLGRLVNDLQDLALAEAGELYLKRQKLPVNELVAFIRRVAQGFGPSLKHQDLQVSVDLPQGERSEVEVDPARLNQVLLNLLSNAQRHTPEGSRIAVHMTMPTPRELQVSVSDTGPGIPLEVLPSLFEHLRSSPGRHRRDEGLSGLGLVISKHLIEAHGGQLWVESQPGSGTTVRFTLPLTQPATDGAERPS